MSKAYFAMALHLHQPIGNFENVLDRVYRNCYLPLIEFLAEYPDIKLALHISGCLLDYFQTRYPEILGKISHMTKDGQIEILSGGYYEPILLAIPHRDLLGQIEMMTGYVRSRFGYEPKGMWIPERVWAPWLSSPINESGARYCILDDTHLLKAGIKKDEMYGYFLTGSGQKKIAVFPSDKRLRYMIPFGQPSDVINYFEEVIKKKREPLFVYGDDAEKFGEWPGTHKWVFEEGWLKRFLELLRANKKWLKLVHFSDYLKSHKAVREVEIPEASYDEMMGWAGGSWMNFLKKYPEADQMHRKMLYVSQKLESAVESKKKDGALKKAKRELYRGQCNCAYWHGVFGGLYLYHLRSAVYNHLIEADKILDEFTHKIKRDWIEIKRLGLTKDRDDEVVIESQNFSMYFDPERGGVLRELDYRPLSVNLVNTLARHREEYHKKIQRMLGRDEGQRYGVQTIHGDSKKIDFSLDEKFAYDTYPRYCLRDYLLDKKSARRLDRMELLEDRGDFANGAYHILIKDKSLLLHRTSNFMGTEVKILKEIRPKNGEEIEVTYNIEKRGFKKLDALLGVEFNFTMPYLNSERYYYSYKYAILGGLNQAGSVDRPASFGIVDSQAGMGMRFDFSKKARKLKFFPVKTISQSERAYELNFQSSCLIPIWELDFGKRGNYGFTIHMHFDSPKAQPAM